MGSDTETEIAVQAHLEQQRLALSNTNRRAGSSWNRGSSAWKVGGKEGQRVRRRSATGVSSNSLEDNEFASFDGLGKRGSKADSQADVPPIDLQVQKQEGIFHVNASVETLVDPDTLYGIITNYDHNARIFRNVDRVEVVDKDGDKVVTQFLHWKFLMWSGNYDVKMRMKDDPKNRRISWDLEQPGFLKVFNGSWTIQPLACAEEVDPGSKLILNQKTLPSFFPPGPLGSYACRIISNQVRNLLIDVATEASNIKKNAAAVA